MSFVFLDSCYYSAIIKMSGREKGVRNDDEHSVEVSRVITSPPVTWSLHSETIS